MIVGREARLEALKLWKIGVEIIPLVEDVKGA